MTETGNNMAGIAVDMLRSLNSTGVYPIMFLELLVVEFYNLVLSQIPNFSKKSGIYHQLDD
jgi:hypothetical protein